MNTFSNENSSLLLFCRFNQNFYNDTLHDSGVLVSSCPFLSSSVIFLQTLLSFSTNKGFLNANHEKNNA